MKTPGYMSYDKYKKNKENDSQKAIKIFVTTFFVMLIVFTAIAKHLSPDVDVVIGDDSEIEAKDTGLGVKRFIDDRLKSIQMEDDSSTVAKRQKRVDEQAPNDNDPTLFEATPDDEKVNLPKHISDTKDNPQKAKSVANKSRAEIEKSLSTPVSSTTSKVVVGYYSTLEQAKVSQGIIIDSGIGVTPFIKDLGGSYTLQVGSYSSREKANSVAQELLRNNFPARVIQE